MQASSTPGVLVAIDNIGAASTIKVTAANAAIKLRLFQLVVIRVSFSRQGLSSKQFAVRAALYDR
jgi:hypothetical protein